MSTVIPASAMGSETAARGSFFFWLSVLLLSFLFIEGVPFIPVVLLGLALAVVAHDLVTARRLHKATWIGCGIIVLATIAQQMVAASEFGLAVVRMMG